MSGNDENSSGCATACKRHFCNCFNSIRKTFGFCCVYFLLQLADHVFVSIILFVIFGLTVSSFFICSLSTSIKYSLYCSVLIICVGISRFFPRGHRCFKKEEEKIQQQQGRIEVNQPSREPVHVVEQPPPEVLNVEDQRPELIDDVAEVLEDIPGIVHVEVHHADVVSDSSNMDEPTSGSSDGPVKQVAPSDSGSNLPRSSTDPSTSTTPLE